MNQKIIIGVIAAIVIVGGAAYAISRNTSKEEVASNQQSKDAMMNDQGDSIDEAMMEKDKMAKDSSGGESMDKPTDKMMEDNAMKKPGAYKDYSSTTIEAEQKAGNKVVLFFHAPWCPYCKAADTAFKTNIEKIPAGVTVLKTDYDSNADLKTKYGVTYQHTFVQIDENEKLITKWNSGDIDLLIKNVK